jgi:hypothetical protein
LDIETSISAKEHVAASGDNKKINVGEPVILNNTEPSANASGCQDYR